MVELTGYNGILRQIAMRGNGHQKPAFLISNDMDAPVERIVGDYARRWRVENVISEAVKFFNLNALSSPILTKVHVGVIMTADGTHLGMVVDAIGNVAHNENDAVGVEFTHVDKDYLTHL